MPIVILSIGLMLSVSSCKKILERKLIKGTFELTYFKLGDLDQNIMELVLKDYETNSSCCRYEVLFDDNGTCTGTYYLNDTVDYSVIGHWELLKRDEIEIQLDLYVNGVYDIEKHDKRNYILTTNSNTTDPSYLGGVESKAEITVKRTDI